MLSLIKLIWHSHSHYLPICIMRTTICRLYAILRYEYVNAIGREDYHLPKLIKRIIPPWRMISAPNTTSRAAASHKQKQHNPDGPVSERPLSYFPQMIGPFHFQILEVKWYHNCAQTFNSNANAFSLNQTNDDLLKSVYSSLNYTAQSISFARPSRWRKRAQRFPCPPHPFA